MSHYVELRRLGGANILKILKEANIKPAAHYATNVSKVNQLLWDYKGLISTKAIIRYLNKDVDEEFKRLAAIELPSTRTQQSHEERYNRYINNSEGKKQIVKALTTIAKLNDPKTDRRIEFNIAIMDRVSKEYFNKQGIYLNGRFGSFEYLNTPSLSNFVVILFRFPVVSERFLVVAYRFF